MKRLSKIKRIFAFSLIFLMSINSFANSVNVNDGSAFITKAEFDALKSSFQAQIDTYNNGIDAKIDEAIATYLKGVTVAKEKTKSLLCSGWQEVGYIENDAMHYTYARPQWSCKIEGVQFDYSTGYTTDTGSAKDFYVISTYKPSAAAPGAKEVDLIKNTAPDKKQDWIWKGFYTNVKWQMSLSDIEPWVPCDGMYYNIKGMYVDGPTFDLAAGVYPNYATTRLRRCIVWNYNTRRNPNPVGNEYYGPYDCVNPNGTSNVISVIYDNDDDNAPTYGKSMPNWDRYIISYKESSKKCNVYADQSYYGSGSVGSSSEYTEQHKDFISATTRTGKSAIWYHYGDSDPYVTPDAYTHVFAGSLQDVSACATSYTGITFDKTKYVPVLGGIKDLVSSKNIRQELDGLTDSTTVDTIKLSDMSLIAGLPLCIEKKDTECTWNIKFKDTTKNYKVWLSYDAFDKNYSATGHKGEPNTDLDLVKIKVDGGTEGTSGLVKNGEGKITWKMNKDSAVYCKWAIADGSGTVTDEKNGILLLKNCNTYTTLYEDK